MTDSGTLRFPRELAVRMYKENDLSDMIALPHCPFESVRWQNSSESNCWSRIEGRRKMGVLVPKADGVIRSCQNSQPG